MDSLLPPRTVEADLGSVLCAKSAHRQTGTGETAAKLLLKRHQELQAGTYIEPSAQRIVISELLNGLLADYEANELHSLDITRQRINKRLRPYFGHVRAINLTTDALNHYIAECRKGLELTGKPKQKPLENGTINRDLAALKRASPGAKQSGGHFNPAIKFTFYRLGNVAPWNVLYYVIAQFVGAISGVASATFVLQGAPAPARPGTQRQYLASMAALLPSLVS